MQITIYFVGLLCRERKGEIFNVALPRLRFLFKNINDPEFGIKEYSAFLCVGKNTAIYQPCKKKILGADINY